ncbi:hypothetical protein HRbin23_01469 [bacterium HR23]|uniref:Hypothetical conserved protein n=1 Tax=uncultured prokaryote TaxID=198431 RepID=H5SLG7_9ZZZZ|nr:hypothetical conserved protein [uncultured prokaryote]GBD11791.1 hypothetical protein HRbin23_01469 [bacterium HR23]
MVKVGCCGFAGSRPSYYRQFGAVEVQQTFYRPPRPETLRKWREEAPRGFAFTIKAFQGVTHPATSPTFRRAGLALSPETREAYGFFRPTPQVWEAWEATRQAALALDAEVVLLQCPPAFTPTPEHLEWLRGFLERKGAHPFLLAWEPRGKEWTDSLVRAVCQEGHLLHAVDPLERAPVTPPPYYFRLHGGPRYAHRHTDEELQRLARLVRGQEGWVFFNNSVHMRGDALRLLALLAEQLV